MTNKTKAISHENRCFERIEQVLHRPLVTFFGSFVFPNIIDDGDADMLEGILQQMDLSNGFALMISSPGGNGLAAERIINVCRKYSNKTGYWAIIPGKAKSAATMICLGSTELVMGPSSELGPVDPQIPTSKEGNIKWYSAFNIVASYEDLFNRAIQEKGNLQPYLQQLANFDEREIRELKSAISLSEDIAVQSLATGMLSKDSKEDIKKKIEMFLTPVHTKDHGRPIYDEQVKKCGLNVRTFRPGEESWKLIYELYIRTNNYVSTKALKVIESKDHSFVAQAPSPR